MKKISIALLFVIISCSDLEFVYNESKKTTNPLFEKTQVSIKGVELIYLNSYVPMFFGENKDDEFDLSIRIEEKQTKLSVETNQVTSNLRYELKFFYNLKSKKEACLVYEKDILSYFSIIPKSSGYNYGTDSSLEKKYEIAAAENLNRFVSFVSSIDTLSCK